MSTFIVIDGHDGTEHFYRTDTIEQIAIAKAALKEAGLAKAEVWCSHCDEPEIDEFFESYKTSRILFA